jgi:hypothetical protein
MTKAEHTSTTTRAPGASPAEDPIYEMLAEHRATVEAYLAASSKDGELEDGTPEWQEASAVTQAAIKREREAALAVLTTDPTTIVGCHRTARPCRPGSISRLGGARRQSTDGAPGMGSTS